MPYNKMNLYDQIRNQVKKIPVGKVSTYGEIARSIGLKDARKVGWAMAQTKDSSVPCHRVVKADGSLAPNFGIDGWKEQKRLLEDEGISFEEGNTVVLNNQIFTFPDYIG